MASRSPSGPSFLGALVRLAVAGVFLFAAAGAAGYAVVYYMVKTPEMQAPDLLALDVAEATRRASDEGFAVRVGGSEASAVLDPGHVLAQRPRPGDWVKPGAVIVVTTAD